MAEASYDLWERFINPDYIKLLKALNFGREFVQAEGVRLHDNSGREYLDFLSGFGVHNVGHNHPRLISVLARSLNAQMPSMLHIDAPMPAGLLAERLSGLMHPDLSRVVFANSGAEAVDIAMKASIAGSEGRKILLACDNAYHGLSVGALSLLGNRAGRERFRTACPESIHIPFNDIGALRGACLRYKPAAFFVEPIQAEGGINIPDPEYLHEAAQICRDHECLFIVDEIQTGLGRTGSFFRTDFKKVVPDIVLVGKALSGGMVPVAAAVINRNVWERAFKGPTWCLYNASTFAGGTLAMSVALETIAVIKEMRLDENARQQGQLLLEGLSKLAAKHRHIIGIRGEGLLFGIEFAPPEGLAIKAVPAWARNGLYANVLSAILLKKHYVITQPCTIAQHVLRIEPPLTICKEEILRFLDVLDQSLSAVPDDSAAVRAAVYMRLFAGA
jgi:acetylornithine/succinyldiaminopimelate/putrescine aminotransferase